MKIKYTFLMLSIAVVLCTAPTTGYAQKSATNEDAASIFIPDFHKKVLSSLLKVSPAFDLNENIRLKPDVAVSYIKNDEETTAAHRDSNSILKPFNHNPFHDSAISISLPFPVTQSLSIAPAITYAFSINDTSRQENRGKRLINLMDRDSAIVYGGVHLRYTF